MKPFCPRRTLRATEGHGGTGRTPFVMLVVWRGVGAGCCGELHSLALAFIYACGVRWRGVVLEGALRGESPRTREGRRRERQFLVVSFLFLVNTARTRRRECRMDGGGNGSPEPPEGRLRPQAPQTPLDYVSASASDSLPFLAFSIALYCLAPAQYISPPFWDAPFDEN